MSIKNQELQSFAAVYGSFAGHFGVEHDLSRDKEREPHLDHHPSTLLNKGFTVDGIE